MSALSEGATLNNRYTIIEALGQGGFSTTYRAKDTEAKRQCVIKCLSIKRAEDWKSIELFEREAKILANLDHPQIPRFIDFFQIEAGPDSQACLVQDYIKGDSLAALIAKGRHLTEKEALEIAFQVCQILEYLHQFSPPIIHRDLKPSNILLNGGHKAFLIDFGAVKDELLHHERERGATVIGTFGYMPIEQFEGRAVPASDIYSLGVTLVNLLSHKEPGEMEKTGLKLNYKPYVNLSAGFQRVLDKMIEPELGRRYGQVAEVKADLLKLLEGKPLAGSQKTHFARMGLIGLSAVMLLSYCGYRLSQERPVLTTASTPGKGMSARDWYLRGNSHFDKGEYTVAVEAYGQAIQLDPGDTQSYYKRGDAYRFLKQFALAELDYTAILERQPRNADVFNRRGMAQDGLKQFELALEDYTRAIGLDPKHKQAYYNRGIIYDNQKRFADAIADYTRAIALDAKYTYAYNNRGWVHYQQKRFEQALADFNRATESDPSYAKPYYNRATIYADRNQHAQAAEEYTRLIALKPGDASLFNSRGLAYQDANKLSQALSDFNKALELNPRYKYAHYNQGNAYDELKKYDLALKAYSKALEIDPGYHFAYNNRGVTYEHMDQLDQALADYSRAIGAKSDYALAYRNRGDIYKMKKQCPQALRDYQSACRHGNGKACSRSCP